MVNQNPQIRLQMKLYQNVQEKLRFSGKRIVMQTNLYIFSDYLMAASYLYFIMEHQSIK